MHNAFLNWRTFFCTNARKADPLAEGDKAEPNKKQVPRLVTSLVTQQLKVGLPL
jgi:hypothetical protein